VSGVLLPAVLAGAAVAALTARPSGRRLQRILPFDSDPLVAAGRPGVRPARIGRQGRSGRSGLPTMADLACLLAAAALAVVIPAPLGLAAAVAVVAVGPRLLRRLEPASVRARRERLAADLPLCLDLLAACLAGGASAAGAAQAVGTAVGGPAGERMARVGAALAVGSPSGQAWAALADPGGAGGPGGSDDPFAPAARALARAAEGGAPVAAAVGRLADEARAQAGAKGEAAARRAGVLAVAPLGLCFLPAFVLLGVVPVVVGLAGPLLSGG